MTKVQVEVPQKKREESLAKLSMLPLSHGALESRVSSLVSSWAVSFQS